MVDAVIIGAGVIGAMVARTLARYPLSVLVLEKENDVMMGATKANSAIVHAGFDAKEGTLKAKLNVKGSEMMEQVAGELGVKYRKNGSLVVGFTPEDRKTLNELLERGQRNGVKGLKLLTREEILEKEPHIGDAVSSALYAPTGAIICPYELGMAALGNAMDNGVSLRTSFTVRGIEKKDGFFRITDGKEFIDAKTVVNCAGVYSDAVAEMVGDCSFSITPRRGEYMLLDKECGYLTDCTVFRCPSAMGKGILVSPTVDGNLLLGPTAENIEDKEDKKTTPAGLAEVARQAKEQVKDLPLNKVITSFSGLRAVGSTGDFILNQPVPGFFNATGIESPGLSSAPAIGEYIAEEMEEIYGGVYTKQ
ncbi:MAG: NAD(P)/FAD-dependent oxidoreductase, partial [Clostridia bacterium]|nr:NAD(P)/FAD-dependent oxidoreductase [Clostridia bacterium]